jgi:hypothetical protein
MARLPDEFLSYAYFWRRKFAQEAGEGRQGQDPSKMMIETTRILPALCNAKKNPDGTIATNAKIIGAGFVPRRDYIDEVTKVFKEHIKKEGMDAASTFAFGRHEYATKEDREKIRGYQKKALGLLLKYLYFEKEDAEKKMDFTKLCTIELGNQYPERPAHAWNYAQEDKKATLLYFTPPVISFEIRCSVEVHLEGPYFDFTHAVHDAYFGEDPSEINQPVYIFNAEEVYNNSATPKGYGIRMV